MSESTRGSNAKIARYITFSLIDLSTGVIFSNDIFVGVVSGRFRMEGVMVGTVLVVERDPETADVVSRTLAEGPDGYDVVVASCMVEALEMLSSRRVDALVFETGLDGASRLAALPRIHHDHPDLAIIVITGSDSVATAVDAMRAGASAVVEKIAAWPCQVRAHLDQWLDHYGDGFVGRDAELAALRIGLDDASAGRGRLMLVAGEPGIGKTRLVQEIARHARNRGAHVLWGHCESTSGAPALWPWVEILRDHAAGTGDAELLTEMGSAAAEVATVVPELAPRLGVTPAIHETQSPDTRFLQLDGVARFVRRLAERRATVLLLEDLHAADESTLRVLGLVVRHVAETRLLLVGTYRDTEPGPALQALAALASAPAARSLGLRGFDIREAADFVNALTDGAASEPLVALLLERTNGNPFFLGETVQLLRVGGLLGSGGAPHGAGRLEVPATVSAAIRRRVARLSETCRRVVDASSVLGTDIDLAVLADITGLGIDAVLHALEEAAGPKILEPLAHPSMRLGFRHGLIRDALYDEMRATERRQLHRRAARALETLYADNPRPRLADIAHHCLEAGGEDDLAKAVGYAIRAAERAVEFMAWDQAARHYGTALKALDLGRPAATGERSVLLAALADTLWCGSHVDQARASAADALVCARDDGAPDLLARAALAYAGPLFGIPAIICDETVVAVLEEALRALPPVDGALRARVMARLAEELTFSRAHEGRWTLGREAIEMARRLDQPKVLAAVLRTIQWALWVPEDAEHRQAVCAGFTALAQRIGDRALALEGALQRAWSHLEFGRVDEAEQALEEADRLAQAVMQPYYRWLVALGHGFVALARGWLDDVEVHAMRARDVGAQVLNPNVALLFGFQVGSVSWLRGRFDELFTANSAAAAMYPLLQPALEAVVPLSYAEAGRLDDARREFERFTPKVLTDVPRNSVWLPTISYHAEACALLSDRPRAEVLYDLLLPFADRLVTYPPSLAFAPAAYYLGLLATTLDRRDDAARHFEAALVMQRRAGNRSWLARTLVAYGELLARGSPEDHEQAVRFAAEAITLAEAVNMPTTLRRARDLAERLGSGNKIAAPVSSQPVRAALRLTGRSFTMSYGGETFLLRPMKGLHHLRVLLRDPGREFWALELARLVEGNGAEEQPNYQAPIASDLDARALAEIRARRAALEGELAEVRRTNDLGRQSTLIDEIEQLEDAVLRGAATQGDDHERARSAVTKALASAIREIAGHHPGLGHHLRTHVVTGRLCRYEPDPEHPIRWDP